MTDPKRHLSIAPEPKEHPPCPVGEMTTPCVHKWGEACEFRSVCETVVREAAKNEK